MKTKHLFFATALVASFASCTNEEIVEQQGVANVERPSVENVKLNFVGEGVDSRLTFGSKGYAWEASDVIGALLMDQPKSYDKKADWHKKYQLTNSVNTSYPFAYNADTKVWSNDAKMLEGNYFFAFPFSSYDGGRQVIHSLTEQTQAGVASKAVAESYAKNQFFVGYSQIFGGTETEDALEDVEMTSILGGLQFRIINNGTKTYHINKLVVRGTNVASELQLTPDMEDNTKDFNYANYVGDKDATNTEGALYVYNPSIAEAEDFNRADLLRAIVADYDSEAGKAQLNVTGTKAERAIAVGATGYAVVMVNPIAEANLTDLCLDIYTDEGVITGINLKNKVVDVTSAAYKANPVLVDKAVKEIAHDVANTVVIKFADGAVGSIQAADIYDENDLLQLIEWNANSDIKVAPVAKLMNDVEFTKEMFELLKSNKNVTLGIQNATGVTPVLTLAEDLPADVLSYEGLEIAAEVELVVEGTIEAAEDDEDKTEVIFNKMTIAEGGVLNVNNADPVLPASIINEGTINFGEKTIAVVELTNEEEGIINIAKGADVKGEDNTKFVNNGTINNNGYLEHVANNEDAVIVLGEKATLKDLVNNADATVNTAKDSQIIGTNAGLINWVTGATVNLSSNTGMVSAEAPASVAKDAYKDSFINTLRLKENTVTTFASDEPGATLNIIAAKGATLKVANGEDLVLGTLIVEEDLTIVTNNVAGTTASSLTVGTVKIAEDAELTNNGKLIVSTSWTNEGIVYNNGAANLYHNATPGTFKYAQPTYGDAPSTAKTKQEVMDAAVVTWAGEWAYWSSRVDRADYFNGNPYDFKTFINAMKLENVEKWVLAYDDLVEKFYGTTDAKKDEAKEKMFNVTVNSLTGKAYCYDFEPAEFKTAVEKVLKGTAATDGSYPNLTAAKKALIFGSDKAKAGQFIITLNPAVGVFADMTEVRNNIATQAFANTANFLNGKTFMERMAVWAVSTTDIESAITATKNANNWIMTTDDIVAVAKLWKKYSTTFKNATTYGFSSTATENTVAKLQAWWAEAKSKEMNAGQQLAFDEIKVYNSFIEGLVADDTTTAANEATYTAEQITAAASAE